MNKTTKLKINTHINNKDNFNNNITSKNKEY